MQDINNWKHIKSHIIDPQRGREIVLIRHGSTSMNTNGDRIRGWKDVPLSPQGVKEVEATGKAMKDKGIKLDGIITSDLSRTVRTAEIISKALGVPILAKTIGLRPWNLGVYTGQESKKVHGELRQYVDDGNKVVPEGESFNTFKHRFLGTVMDILDKYKDKKIAIVTHHRGDRLMNAWLKAGGSRNENVDDKVFTEMGIPPGGYEILTIK